MEKVTEKKSSGSGCILVAIFLIAFLFIGKKCIWGPGEEEKRKMEEGKVLFFSGQTENLDSLRYYCLKSKTYATISNSCQEIWAKKQAEYEDPKGYNEMYGKPIHAMSLYNLFRDNEIEAGKACNKNPVQIEGIILEMGTNSIGNYIDLNTSGKAADIRVFLEAGEWNNNAIAKIKTRNTIVAGGLCYGRTETFGIKTKIVIGNARILKVNGDFL